MAHPSNAVMQQVPASSGELLLVYDGQCPVCSLYCRMLRLRQAGLQFHLKDARQHPELVRELHALGLDVNEGIVLRINGQLYHGADAMHLLALLGSPSHLFNRVNAWIFRSRSRAAFLYPILKAGRNVLLRLLGRRPLQHVDASSNG